MSHCLLATECLLSFVLILSAVCRQSAGPERERDGVTVGQANGVIRGHARIQS